MKPRARKNHRSNKPRNLRGERAERSGEREEARDHRDAETDKGGGAKRERLQYQKVDEVGELTTHWV